ncbi:hypothetical protein PIB30_071351 [Stylosanthes scabra]|uniref:Uncharacterized protein n=1 Tax=Stylosanthes scabra TaxID=79078 RepID=A0ABU6WNH1_9FABA|nr:hypothetical protein [Stylosanthes scabra]
MEGELQMVRSMVPLPHFYTHNMSPLPPFAPTVGHMGNKASFQPTRHRHQRHDNFLLMQTKWTQALHHFSTGDGEMVAGQLIGMSPTPGAKWSLEKMLPISPMAGAKWPPRHSQG